jgi:hypothetical protein
MVNWRGGAGRSQSLAYGYTRCGERSFQWICGILSNLYTKIYKSFEFLLRPYNSAIHIKLDAQMMIPKKSLME